MITKQFRNVSAFGLGLAMAGLLSVGGAGAATYAPDTIFSSDHDYHTGEFVLGPTVPGKWGGPVMGTPGGTVTYSFMADGVSCAGEFAGCVISSMDSFMPVGWKTEVEAAFAAWSAVADIQFMEVPDLGEAFNAPGGSGDMRFGGHVFDGPSGTLAHGFYPPVNGTSAAGDMHFDIEELWKIGFGGPGFDIFQVTAHEIGHAIGLDHTPVPGSLMNPFYTEAFVGLQADDIAGAQFIYGPAEVTPPIPVPAALPMLASALALFGVARRFRRD